MDLRKVSLSLDHIFIHEGTVMRRCGKNESSLLNLITWHEFLVCGYTGGCLKCTTMGLKLVLLSDNLTTCCTSNIATVGAEYIDVYEKPSDCPAWLEKTDKVFQAFIGNG